MGRTGMMAALVMAVAMVAGGFGVMMTVAVTMVLAPLPLGTFLKVLGTAIGFIVGTRSISV
tara:strand:+ start:427 stop:609 length:183 start_codon:yes stop_codon:yes gene_type:complete